MTNVESERHEPGEQKSAQEIFFDYARKLELGTPPYLAFCDYLKHTGLYDEILFLTRLINKQNSEGRVTEVSQLRTAETKMALLDLQISNRKTELRGYDEAYEKTENMADKVVEEIEDRLFYQYGTEHEKEGERIFYKEKSEILDIAKAIVKTKAT